MSSAVIYLPILSLVSPTALLLSYYGKARDHVEPLFWKLVVLSSYLLHYAHKVLVLQIRSRVWWCRSSKWSEQIVYMVSNLETST